MMRRKTEKTEATAKTHATEKTTLYFSSTGASKSARGSTRRRKSSQRGKSGKGQSEAKSGPIKHAKSLSKSAPGAKKILQEAAKKPLPPLEAEVVKIEGILVPTILANPPE